MGQFDIRQSVTAQMDAIRITRQAALVASLAQGLGELYRVRGPAGTTRAGKAGSSRARNGSRPNTVRAHLMDSFRDALDAERPGRYRIVHPDAAWRGSLNEDGSPKKGGSALRRAWERMSDPKLYRRVDGWQVAGSEATDPARRAEPIMDIMFSPACGLRSLVAGADCGSMSVMAGGARGVFDSAAADECDDTRGFFVVLVVGPAMAGLLSKVRDSLGERLGDPVALWDYAALWHGIRTLQENLQLVTEQSAVVGESMFASVKHKIREDWRLRVLPGGAVSSSLMTLHPTAGSHISLVCARKSSVVMLAAITKCMGGAMLAVPVSKHSEKSQRGALGGNDVQTMPGARILVENDLVSGQAGSESVFVVGTAITNVPGFLGGVRFITPNTDATTRRGDVVSQSFVTNVWDGTHSTTTCEHDLARQRLWHRQKPNAAGLPELLPAGEVMGNIHRRLRGKPHPPKLSPAASESGTSRRGAADDVAEKSPKRADSALEFLPRTDDVASE